MNTTARSFHHDIPAAVVAEVSSAPVSLAAPLWPPLPHDLPAPLTALVTAIEAFTRYCLNNSDSSTVNDNSKHMEFERAQEILLGDFSASSDHAATKLLYASTETAVAPRHALHLLQAYGQSIHKKRLVSWSELIAMLQFSAAPLGRMILDAGKQPQYTWKFSDPLCMAYGVLGCVAHAKHDFLMRQRVFLPDIWLRNAGAAPHMLLSEKTSPELRFVFDQMLDGAAKMLLQANGLVEALDDKALKIYAARALQHAWALHHLLRKSDPLSSSVALSRPHKLLLDMKARFQVWRGKP